MRVVLGGAWLTASGLSLCRIGQGLIVVVWYLGGGSSGGCADGGGRWWRCGGEWRGS